MTAEIIPFPTPRPWAKYTHNAKSRASTERLFEALLNFREKSGPAVGDGPQTTPVESMTVELLGMALDRNSDPPPAS